MTSEPEFAELHTRAEAIRSVVLGTLAGAVVVIASRTWLFPSIREFANSAQCRTVFGFEGLTVLWYGVFVGIPLSSALLVIATIGWRGYKVLRDGQFPPAGEKVYKPTRIRRGSQARLIGYLHFLAFAPFLAISIWGGFQAEELSRTTQPKPGVCAASLN